MALYLNKYYDLLKLSFLFLQVLVRQLCVSNRQIQEIVMKESLLSITIRLEGYVNHSYTAVVEEITIVSTVKNNVRDNVEISKIKVLIQVLFFKKKYLDTYSSIEKKNENVILYFQMSAKCKEIRDHVGATLLNTITKPLQEAVINLRMEVARVMEIGLVQKKNVHKSVLRIKRTNQTSLPQVDFLPPKLVAYYKTKFNNK